MKKHQQMDMTKKKRVLVIGTNQHINTVVARHVYNWIRNGNGVKWAVVSSHEKVLEEWREEKDLAKMTQAKDWREGDEKNVNLIVDQVTAASFYSKTGIKSLIENAGELIFVSANPLHYLPESCLKTFDEVVVAKLTSAERQAQVHAIWLMKKGVISLDTFKNQVKKLDEYRYVRVMDNGGRLEEVVMMNDPAPKSCVSENKSSWKTPSKTPSIPSSLPRPKSVPVSSSVVERWVIVEAVDSSRMPQIVKKFEEMFATELVRAMFMNGSKEVGQDKMTYYFQVHAFRQDLFASLAMNVLSALKNDGLIKHGYVAL